MIGIAAGVDIIQIDLKIGNIRPYFFPLIFLQRLKTRYNSGLGAKRYDIRGKNSLRRRVVYGGAVTAQTSEPLAYRSRWIGIGEGYVFHLKSFT